MSKFKLKPGLLAMFLPGIGKLGPEGFVEGDQYQRFVPQFLVEVTDDKSEYVVVPTPKVAEPVVPEVVIPPPVIVPPVAVVPAPVPVPTVVVTAVVSTPSTDKPVGSVENQVKGKKRK